MWSGDTFLQLDFFCILFLGYLHWGPSTDIVSVIEFKNLLLYFLCKSFVCKIFAFLTDNFTLPTNSFTTARFCVEILVGVYLMCWLLFLKLNVLTGQLPKPNDLVFGHSFSSSQFFPSSSFLHSSFNLF